jgi:hypothetical protein
VQDIRRSIAKYRSIFGLFINDYVRVDLRRQPYHHSWCCNALTGTNNEDTKVISCSIR